MDLIKINTLGKPRADAERARAEKTAGQFEQMFVRTMVSSLRSTASFGGEGAGMFGSGPGSDTFGDWFDQNLAEQVSHSTRVGIADQLLKDLERHQEIPAATAEKAERAKQIADHSALRATTTMGKGAFNVVL